MKEKIVAYINDIADGKGISVTEDTDLYETGVLDSVEIIMLLSFLQDELGVQFDSDDLNYENFQTVAAIVRWAESGRG